MFHVWDLLIKLLKFLQWESMGVYDFSIVKDRRLFGINTNFRIDHKSIPYTDNDRNYPSFACKIGTSDVHPACMISTSSDKFP